jgi:hypothetical protein
MNTTNTSRKGLTSQECKSILFKVGIKFGISPRLISERLLSDLDKEDMMEGKISIASLEAHTELWKASGMPDLVKRESNRPQTLAKAVEKPSCHYRKPFVCPESRLDCYCRQEKTCR